MSGRSPIGAPRALDWLLLSAVILAWGTAFTLTAVAVASVPPLSIAAGRIVIGALLLWTVARARGVRLPRDRHTWSWFALLALFGDALPFFAIGWGQGRVDSGLAGILMAVMPLATLVMAHYFVPGERMSAGKALGFVLGFGGIVVLMGPEALRELGDGGSDVFRQAAVLGGALCYAVFAVLIPRAPALPPLVLATGSLLAASVMMLPLALLVDRPWTLRPPPEALGSIALLGAFATAVATLLYFRVLARTGPTFVALANFVIPLVALGSGMWWMDEQPRADVWLALGLILAGLAFGQARANPPHAGTARTDG